jgi:hypothetical protein
VCQLEVVESFPRDGPGFAIDRAPVQAEVRKLLLRSAHGRPSRCCRFNAILCTPNVILPPVTIKKSAHVVLERVMVTTTKHSRLVSPYHDWLFR